MFKRLQLLPGLSAILFAMAASIAGAQASALAAAEGGSYKINQVFSMQGVITNYYGREKSAESYLWFNAQRVCDDLAKDVSTGLILNRVSEVTYATAHSTTTASASFLCVPVGLGD